MTGNDGGESRRVNDTRRVVIEHPSLQSHRSEMVQQLQRVADDPEYHEMMYSHQTTPITFTLVDRFEEMHAMQNVLRSHQPNSARKAHGTDL